MSLPDPYAPDVSVIVPTYCEAENLPVLIPRIAEALLNAGLDGEIIVVDDDSPDATEQVCLELSHAYPVRLIVRQGERGLSSAVIRGMQSARGEVLLVMDADLSHPPEKVPELVRVIQDDEAEFVIGSRYVPGGSTEEDWGFYRWLNSRVATLLARPLTSARDPMAGFFALARRSFQGARSLNPIGYKIGLELLVKANCRRVREVPIPFRDRLHGSSKLSLNEQINYVRHLVRLYEYKLGAAARPLKFAAVGSTGMVIDLLSFNLLLGILPLGPARACAIWLAMTWNFLLNRKITFPEASRDSMIRQYVLFTFSCMLGAVLNWTVSVSLCRYVRPFDEWVTAAATMGVLAGTIFNYVLSSTLVFRTTDAGQPKPLGPAGDSRETSPCATEVLTND